MSIKKSCNKYIHCRQFSSYRCSIKAMFIYWTWMKHTLNELCTNVSSRSMTIHFLCISWCLTGGSKGRGAWSVMTSKGGEARPSTLLAPPPPGGPLPRPPRQQHNNDRRNPPLPLDFFCPKGVDPDTGVPSPSLCCPPGDDPKKTISR